MNQTTDRYIVSIGDVKLRLILQTMMKFTYKLDDKVSKLAEEIGTPFDMEALMQSIDSKFAAKLNDVNNFVNQKLDPILFKIANDNNEQQGAVISLLQKLEKLEWERNELINRVDWLEKMLDKVVVEDVSTKEKETKPKKKSIWDWFKKAKK